MKQALLFSICVTATLAGCVVTENSTLDGTNGQAIPQTVAPAPPGAPEGTCWDKTVTPAVIETVREDILLEPAVINASGNVVTPPVYRTETRQQIVVPRQDKWFETPCADQLTPEFVSSLQRALQARGLYRGKVDGKLSLRTRRAVKTYQSASGVQSATLSLESARSLGLIAVPRDPAE